MGCRLEENSRLFEVLSALAKGYETGSFRGFFPYLAQDCVQESQWRFTPKSGYEDVVSYFTAKGKALADSECFPKCYMVELVDGFKRIRNTKVSLNWDQLRPIYAKNWKGNSEEQPKIASVGLLYDSGKLCLYMEQKLNGETNPVIGDVKLDEGGMVKKINICVPELFNFRDFTPYVCFFPTTDDWQKNTSGNREREDHLVRVSESYYPELYLFLACAGESFDEYDDQRIPVEHWCAALRYWKDFVTAKDFDEAFKKVSGVVRATGRKWDPEFAEWFGRLGKAAWENRKINWQMLNDLIVWTDLYKDDYVYINTLGW